ncbi:RNAse P Rpr2/Rpp21/SNM1 subunit domain-domain-containing protein [Leucosporidium creatinivorum]|uniref:RNAse P Rpr2/Rpp21/SNM1 subunit domain-domain-containing protein n=1 Tax=Leucosporidium creatinivorum TaxID=106004 RepID=A0A1Y2DGZ8_9BASI|nr:RNAse P Rpr2/Rpp21/SNM1 subunit domain-domain-containing protein [Leucosporidium creatinivorum]
MAKKQRGAVPSPTASTTVPSKDILQRLSYLYQASVFLSNVLPSSQASSSTASQAKRRDFLIPTQANQLPARPPVKVGEGTSASAGGRDGRKQGGANQRQATAAGAEDGDGAPRPKKRKRLSTSNSSRKRAERPVSRLLIKTMGEVAKKATVRMDPTVKRTMCKGCSAVLVPGVTSTVRVKPSGPHAHLVVHTCLTCGTRRRLPAPPHLPDEPEPLETKDGAPLRPAEDSMDVEEPTAEEESKEPSRKQTKRERKEARQARRPVFFERAGHLTFAGGEQISRN